MNKVILIGKLVKDPVLFAEGKVAKLRLATRVGYDVQKQEDKMAFVTVTAFQLSKAQLDSLKKGTTVGVEGMVAETTFDRDSKTVYQTEVQVGKGGLRFL